MSTWKAFMKADGTDSSIPWFHGLSSRIDSRDDDSRKSACINSRRSHLHVQPLSMRKRQHDYPVIYSFSLLHSAFWFHRKTLLPYVVATLVLSCFVISR
uniref:Uncharacterized protein n=1 Tax=Arundo donax TaxID=35708 RepID=A0A0A9C4N0_ARUDO